jgi:tetratricopeptide (TPR) repeat protein
MGGVHRLGDAYARAWCRCYTSFRMRPARVLSVLALVAASWPASRIARADTPPSVWDVAKDTAEADRWALHVKVQRLLHSPPAETPEFLELRRDQELRLESARMLLEQADAGHSPDARLRFDLGTVYEDIAVLERRTDLTPRAVAVLAPALEAFPDAPGSTGALDSLVDAYAHLNRPHEEVAAATRYIPRLLDDRARVGPLMNLGEAEMRLGQLDDALATLREGLRECERLPNSSGVNETYALTLWDVAVALDRSGDPAGAETTAAKARGWSWSEAMGSGAIQMARLVTGWDAIRNTDDVFFVPEWERDWYLALGESVAAQGASDPRDAAHGWAEAERHWMAYVSGAIAEGSTDRWLPLARARLARTHAARVAAEKRAAKLPPRAASPDGTTTL